MFVTSTYGSHHTRLINSTNIRWNEHVRKDKREVGPNPLSLWPVLPNVDSGESFGLVKPEDMVLFDETLDTIKSEDENEEGEAISNSLLLHDDNDAIELMSSLKIDPALLKKPQLDPHGSSSNIATPFPSQQITVMPPIDPPASTESSVLVDQSNNLNERD